MNKRMKLFEIITDTSISIAKFSMMNACVLFILKEAAQFETLLKHFSFLF